MHDEQEKDITMDNQQVSSIGTKLIPIPEFELYFTDTTGTIFSFKRGGKEKILSPYLHYGKSKNPYMRVKIINKLWLLHRLIGSVNIGRQLNKDEVINHINGVTTDNRLTNLEVITQRENVNHAVSLVLYCSGDEWYEARKYKPNRETSTTIPRGSTLK